MQKHVNLVDLVKSFPTNIYLQNLASIQKRTSPVKFAHLAEKSGKGSMSNLSTKVPALTKYLEHHLFYVRSSAADALGNLGEHAASAVPGMTKCLEVSRLRSEVNIELNFPPKLRGARSRLYRRRFLQVNTHWKALAEIYTMHSFAPFSNLNFFVKNRQNFCDIE